MINKISIYMSSENDEESNRGLDLDFLILVQIV